MILGLILKLDNKGENFVNYFWIVFKLFLGIVYMVVCLEFRKVFFKLLRFGNCLVGLKEEIEVII